MPATPFRTVMRRLAHLVLAVALSDPALILRLILIINHDIQISPVVRVRLAAQLARYRFSRLHRQHVGKVEHRLFPMRVLGMRAGAEANGLVAGGELDIEPGNQGVDIVGTSDLEVEGKREGEVGGGHLVQVKSENGAGVGHDGFKFDGVDEGLGESSELERGVVEAIDVVPDWKKMPLACAHMTR